LGVSYTIADFPKGAGFDAVDWQVGHTDIRVDCPFSNLPGMDRLFMVIEGRGVELTCIDESGRKTANRVEPLRAPFAFRGDWTTSCRLIDGPVKVFNVMTRRGRFSASVQDMSSMDTGFEGNLIAVALPGLEAWIVDGDRPPDASSLLVRIRKA